MSFQKLKSDSYSVGGRHISSTSKVYGDIVNGGGRKVKIGYRSFRNRKKSMTVSDNLKKVKD